MHKVIGLSSQIDGTKILLYSFNRILFIFFNLSEREPAPLISPLGIG